MGLCGLLLFILLVSAARSENYFAECSPPMNNSHCICDESGYILKCETYRPTIQLLNKKRYSGRIVGGIKAEILEYPYMLGLEFFGTLICGATIIGSRWAVTAGHCVSVTLVRISLKLRALTDKSVRGGYIFRISKYIMHPDYDYFDDSEENDIALLRVDESFSQTDPRLTPAKLPEPNEDLPVGTMVTVLGWGYTTEDGPKSDHLLRVTMPVTSYEFCNSRFDSEITSALMICAGSEGGKDACKGDSGGPLIFNNTLYGIVSFGEGCGDADIPGVYTKVSAYREWIKQETEI